MENHKGNAKRRQEQLINLAVAAGGSWMMWYLSGPYAAEIGRNLYEWFYGAIWGKPEWFSFRFFERAFIYNPNRGHIENWLYNYAEYICPIVASPFLYKLPDFV